MSLDELLQRPDLIDKLVAYHIAPRARAPMGALTANTAAAAAAAGTKQPAGNSSSKAVGSYAVSGDPHYFLRFSADPKTGTPTVEDAQGNVARVVKGDLDAGASVVHGVDKVLYSGKSATPRTVLTLNPKPVVLDNLQGVRGHGCRGE